MANAETRNTPSEHTGQLRADDTPARPAASVSYLPRQPRLEIVGLPHHAVQRGVDRQAVFFEHQCYMAYLQMLSAYAADLDVSVHSGCLMTNHVHLLLTPHVPGSLSRLMQRLNRLYVQKINARFERTGHHGRAGSRPA